LFFTTKTAAEKELARIKIKQRQEGMDTLSLSDDLRIATLTIQKDLEPFGKTLRDAGAHYLKFLKDSHRSITVSALADEYLALKKRLALSPLHLKDLRNRYNIFCADFGQTLIRTIELEQVESWLNGLPLSPQSVNNYKGRLSALFRYFLAKHQDAAKLALDLGHTNSKLIFSNYREIVTPEEGERYWFCGNEKPAHGSGF
jgi:hypothetical protein